MTILEAIQANPTFSDIPEATLVVALVNRGVDPNTEYTGSDEQKKALELASADMYVEMSTTPSWKEGQLSVTYDWRAIINRAIAIYKKYDDPAGEGLGDREINVVISDASDFA